MARSVPRWSAAFCAACFAVFISVADAACTYSRSEALALPSGHIEANVTYFDDDNGTVAAARFDCAAGYELKGEYLLLRARGTDPCEWRNLDEAGDPSCKKCRVGHYRPAHAADAAPERARCVACPNEEYTHKNGSTKCWKCPTVGVTCTQGTFTIQPGWWFAFSSCPASDDTPHVCAKRGRYGEDFSDSIEGVPYGDDRDITKDAFEERCSGKREPGTCMFKCKADGPRSFCATTEEVLNEVPPRLPAEGLERVKCRPGYTGVMCGGCEFEPPGRRFMREGNKCTECLPLWQSILLLSGLGVAGFGFLFYILGFHNLTAKPFDHAVVYQKSLFSFFQMVGALGVLKAKGTAAFQQYITGPSTTMGGSFSRQTFLKCLYGSAVYFGFLINMLSPIVIALVAALMMIPLSYVLNKLRTARRLASGGSIGEPPARKLVLLPRIAPSLYRFPVDKIPAFMHCLTRPMEDSDRREWRAIMRERLRPFLGVVRLYQVMAFLMFLLFPTLVGSVVTVLNCTGEIRGVTYVVADLREVCWSGDHITFAVLAIVGAVVYGVGIPLAFLFLLLCKVEEVVEDIEDAKLRRTNSLRDLRNGVDVSKKKCTCCAPRERELDDLDDTDERGADSSEEESDSDDDYSSSEDDEEEEEVGAGGGGEESAFDRWRRLEKENKKKKKAELARGGRREASGDSDSSSDDDSSSEDEDEWEEEEAAAPPLPPGWEERYSEEHQCAYFMHMADGKTEWVRPVVLPPGWTKHWSDEHDTAYYHHTDGRDSWEIPLSKLDAKKAAKAAKKAAKEAKKAAKKERKKAAKIAAKKEKHRQHQLRKFNRKEMQRLKKEQADEWYEMVVNVETDLEERSPEMSRRELRDYYRQGFNGRNDLFFQACDPQHFVTLEKILNMNANKCRCTRMKCGWRPRKEYEIRNGKLSDFRQSYGFLLAGYSSERGKVVKAWEVVIMIRKLVIATIAASASADAYLQILLALLLLVVSLTLQAKFDPYIGRESSDILNHVETWSLFFLVVTQIVSIVYLYVDEEEGQAPQWMKDDWFEPAVTVVLCFLNVSVIAVITSLFLWSKLFPEHYHPAEQNGFKCCTKKHWAKVLPCLVKWEPADEVKHWELKVAETKELRDDAWAAGGWFDGTYTRTNHGIPVSEFNKMQFVKEVARYTVHRKYELRLAMLAAAKAKVEAEEEEEEVAEFVDHNPVHRVARDV